MKLEGRINNSRIFISESEMKSLTPRLWIEDRIIYEYMVSVLTCPPLMIICDSNYLHGCNFFICLFCQALLRHREEYIATSGIWERKQVYYLMDPYFTVLGKQHFKGI